VYLSVDCAEGFAGAKAHWRVGRCQVPAWGWKHEHVIEQKGKRSEWEGFRSHTNLV